LVRVYKQDILDLEKLIARDLTTWLRDPSNPLQIPQEFKDKQKVEQAKYFDEALDEEFEIERPFKCGALYEWSIWSKFERALSMLSFTVRGASVLEICCGSGMGTEIFAKAGCDVCGYDVSSGSIGRARERAKRHHFDAKFLVGDAEHLPFPDGAFDIVAVHDGLHHLPNPHLAIAEMVRVAKKAIVVIEPARSWLTRRAVDLKLALDYEEAGNYVYRLRETDVFDIARKGGFKRLSYRQYLLYYRHQPFKFARHIENPILLKIIKASFQLVSSITPRLGNKITIVCEK
jgi:SAM-dependent methyltransferase